MTRSLLMIAALATCMTVPVWAADKPEANEDPIAAELTVAKQKYRSAVAAARRLAVAGAMVVGEALRQTGGFADASRS